MKDLPSKTPASYSNRVGRACIESFGNSEILALAQRVPRGK